MQSHWDEVLAGIKRHGPTRLRWTTVDPEAVYPHPRFKAVSPCGTIEFRLMVYQAGNHLDGWHVQWLDIDGHRRFWQGSSWHQTLEGARNAAENQLDDWLTEDGPPPK